MFVSSLPPHRVCINAKPFGEGFQTQAVDPPVLTYFSAKRDIRLDPFAGSGTTLQMALNLGRVPLGVELNKKYIRKLIMPAILNMT